MSTPVIVPLMMVPFLSSIVTLSLLSFIKKRTSFMMANNFFTLGREVNEAEFLPLGKGMKILKCARQEINQISGVI
jgi:hypothetical protein